MNTPRSENRSGHTPPAGPRGPGGPGGGPMAGMRAFGRPKDTRKTVLRLLYYLNNRKLALTVVVVLMFLSTASMLAGNYLLKPLINNYILPGDFAGLGQALLGLAAIYLVGVAASYYQSRLMIQVAQKTTNRLRRELFVKLQSLPLKYFDANTHGDLMSRFTNDIDNVQMALEQSLVQLISSSLSFAGSVIMMLILSPVLFLVSAVMLAVMFFLSTRIGGKSRNYFRQQQANLGEVNGYVEEMVDGLKVVKVFTHEQDAIAEFKRRNEAYRQAATNANFLAGAVMPIMANLNNIAYAATAMFGGILAVVSSFDIGSLAAFLQYARAVGWPVQQITNQFNNL